MLKYSMGCLMCIALLACEVPTKFVGEPKFPGGVASCRATCQREGLELGGFVYSGEFATSCVCSPPRAPGASAAAEANPTAGVVVQTQAAAAAAAANAQQLRMQQQQQQSQI